MKWPLVYSSAVLFTSTDKHNIWAFLSFWCNFLYRISFSRWDRGLSGSITRKTIYGWSNLLNAAINIFLGVVIGGPLQGKVLIQTGLKPTIYHAWNHHANHYTTDAVHYGYNWNTVHLTVSNNQSIQLFLNIK